MVGGPLVGWGLGVRYIEGRHTSVGPHQKVIAAHVDIRGDCRQGHRQNGDRRGRGNSVEEILKSHKVNRYITVNLVEEEEHSYRQSTPGRPTPKTRYIRKTRKYYRLAWELDEGAIEYDRKSDGMYPLLTNDRELTPAQVLEAHKNQPSIEKRFEQTKTVFEIAPVFLKNEDRVEALSYLYFIALVVQSLIEREIRLSMERAGIEALPLYPEERENKRPTCEQIFRLFSQSERHALKHGQDTVKTFNPELTPLQYQVLALLGMSSSAHTSLPVVPLLV
jgi:transposase